MGLTTDPNDPALGRGEGGLGMNAKYLVLNEEERSKGFVRPVRFSYIHIGREVCGLRNEELFEQRYEEEAALPAGTVAYVCTGEPMHEGECRTWAPVDERKMARLERMGMLGGCGVVTRMAQAIAETYARDPSFYGATFCVYCNTHLPVGAQGEFIWDVGGAHADMTAEDLCEFPRVGA